MNESLNKTKILVLYFGDYKSKIFKNNFFYWKTPADIVSNIIKPLSKISSDCKSINFFEMLGDDGQYELNKKILRLVNESKPDFVFWFTLQYEFYPATLKKIRESGTKLVAFSFDDVWRAKDYVMRLVPDVDILVYNDYTYKDFYKNKVAHSVFSFFYTVPSDSFYKDENCEKIFEITFIGTKTPYRENIINFLKQNNINIEVYGHGWENDYLSIEQCMEIYAKSKINLNINSFFVDYVYFNPRVFQIMLSKGFVITEKPKDMHLYFSEQSNLVTFGTKEDLLEKIKYYLTNESLRIELTKEMYNNVVQNYTAEAVLEKLLVELSRIDLSSKQEVKTTPKESLINKKSYLEYAITVLQARFKAIFKAKSIDEALKHFKIYLKDFWGIVVNYKFFFFMYAPLFLLQEFVQNNIKKTRFFLRAKK